MNIYLWLKLAHIVSSVLLVGTGFGSAFYLFFINRTHNLAAQAEVARLVVRADWWFTTPTVIIQPVTGIAMALLAGIPLTQGWLFWALCLYGLAGLCWLPVVWIQIRMLRLLNSARTAQKELTTEYWYLAKWWEGLGYIAFVAMAGVFYLMVFKPS